MVYGNMPVITTNLWGIVNFREIKQNLRILFQLCLLLTCYC
jgi:hypothetical protein